MIWLLQIILVACLVSDRWTREIQAAEDQMLIAYIGVEKEAEIRWTNFDYPSPMAHRYSLYVMLGAAYLLFMGLTLPFPVPPQAIPVGAVALNVFLANTQKRV